MRKLLFTMTASLLVSGCGLLQPKEPASQPQLELEQKYIVEWIGQRPLIDRSHLSIQLEQQQKAGGFAGCNNWFASYVLQGDKLELDNIATTRKLCAPSLMEQEQSYLEALSQVQRWDFNDIGQLQLWPADGDPIRLWLQSPAINNKD